MSFNIMDAVKGHLTPDLISKASSFLGESESGITKAVSGILPTVLGGMIGKTESGSNGAAEVFNLAKDAHSSNLLGSLGNFAGDGGGFLGKGLNLVKGLFGDKFSGILNAVSSFAGIKSSSVSSLFSMAAPVAAGALGKHAIENKLDAGSFASLLGSQKDSIMKMLPGGLSSIAGMFGMGKISDAVTSIAGGAKGKAAAAYNYADNTASRAKGGMGWLAWLLPLLLAGALAWWFLLGGKSSCNKKEGAEVSGVDTTGTVPSATTTTNDAQTVTADGGSIKVKLPDGVELNALKGGIEDKLVSFLGTEWKSLGADSLKKIWFDFDNLNFETGSSKLTEASMVQVKNIVAVLKAFPDAKIKIGGYTDKVGNDEGNKKLSQSRADAVSTALKTSGADAARITGAEGYGEEFATVDEKAADEERRKDRRIAVSIRQ